MKYELLASDLDGTLISAKNDKDSTNCLDKFCVLANSFAFIAYVTGRHFAYAKNGIEASKLPVPNYLVCDVGTSIYVKNKEKWLFDDLYYQFLSQKWEKGTNLKIKQLLSKISDLSLQEEEKQGIFKCSYYASISTEIKPLLNSIEKNLLKANIEATIVSSKDILEDRILVDILPKEVSKHSALIFLAKKLNLNYDQIIFAGDSGNDLKVFLSDIPSILVGNTLIEIVKQVENQKSNKMFFYSKQNCICGVNDGLKYFLNKS